jgi:hypothetical protein
MGTGIQKRRNGADVRKCLQYIKDKIRLEDHLSVPLRESRYVCTCVCPTPGDGGVLWLRILTLETIRLGLILTFCCCGFLA